MTCWWSGEEIKEGRATEVWCTRERRVCPNCKLHEWKAQWYVDEEVRERRNRSAKPPRIPPSFSFPWLVCCRPCSCVCTSCGCSCCDGAETDSCEVDAEKCCILCCCCSREDEHESDDGLGATVSSPTPVPGNHKTPATVAVRLAARLAAIALTNGSVRPNASSHTPPSVSMPAEFASTATSAATVSQKEASR